MSCWLLACTFELEAQKCAIRISYQRKLNKQHDVYILIYESYVFLIRKTSYLLEALAKGRNMKLIASNIRIQNAPKP